MNKVADCSTASICLKSIIACSGLACKYAGMYTVEMKNKKKQKTLGVRVLKTDWDKLRKLAKANDRTLQSMFGTVVNVAGKMLA